MPLFSSYIFIKTQFSLLTSLSCQLWSAISFRWILSLVNIIQSNSVLFVTHLSVDIATVPSIVWKYIFDIIMFFTHRLIINCVLFVIKIFSRWNSTTKNLTLGMKFAFRCGRLDCIHRESFQNFPFRPPILFSMAIVFADNKKSPNTIYLALHR